VIQEGLRKFGLWNATHWWSKSLKNNDVWNKWDAPTRWSDWNQSAFCVYDQYFTNFKINGDTRTIYSSRQRAWLSAQQKLLRGYFFIEPRKSKKKKAKMGYRSGRFMPSNLAGAISLLLYGFTFSCLVCDWSWRVDEPIVFLSDQEVFLAKDGIEEHYFLKSGSNLALVWWWCSITLSPSRLRWHALCEQNVYKHILSWWRRQSLPKYFWTSAVVHENQSTIDYISKLYYAQILKKRSISKTSISIRYLDKGTICKRWREGR